MESYKNEINDAVETFGGLTAKELELRATIIYFIKECGVKEDLELINKVHELKPIFRNQNTIDDSRIKKYRDFIDS